MLLSSGPSSTVYLHRVTPSDPTDPYPLLTSLHVRHTSISSSAFQAPRGNRIFFAGPHRYFHMWDLGSGSIEKVTRVDGHNDEHGNMERFKLSPCGRWMAIVGVRRGKGGAGVVNVLDARTTQWIAEVRITSYGGVADFAWWRNGEGLCIAGRSGDLIEYHLAQRRVVAQWSDEGAFGTTVIALGGSGDGVGNTKPSTDDPSTASSSLAVLGGDQYAAIGSSSGIINIYDRRSLFTIPSTTSSSLTTNPQPTPSIIHKAQKPLKSLPHLITATSHVVFSPDGQLLAMASRAKKDALRLVHLPSCTVYRNWPTSSTPLGRISAIAFAPDSRMLAVGNEQGRVRVWCIMD